MKPPQVYVDTLDVFLRDGRKAVKLPETNREDFVCLTMAAYCLEKPVSVLQKKGSYYLRREVEVMEDAEGGAIQALNALKEGGENAS